MTSPITTAPGDITVRPSRPDDGEFVAEMIVQGFYDKVTWAVGESSIPSVKEYEAALHRDPSCPLNRYIIAEYKGKQAGMAIIAFKEDPKPNYTVQGSSFMGCCTKRRWSNFHTFMDPGPLPEKMCYLDKICVNSEFRGLGIGKVLLDHIEQEAREKGCQRMMLYVKQSNRAQSLYERQGYEVEESVDGCCFTWCAFGARYFNKMVKVL